VSVCQGDVRNGTIEGIELKCPVLVEGRSLCEDSGGAGKYRGGLAINLRVRNFVEGRWNLMGPKRIGCPPQGLWGGAPGSTAKYMLKQPGESKFHEMDSARHPVPVNSEVIVRTGGGGGWGNPYEREPDSVRRDVAEGMVSIGAARDDYGVVLDEDDLSIDDAATEELRANGGRR
jgi:N-methylhydantoinase B